MANTKVRLMDTDADYKRMGTTVKEKMEIFRMVPG